MTLHFLRMKWMPAGEAALRHAYDGGLLAERNWCELKAALGSGPGANAELARDLASLAVDGGTLIIGLDEKEPGGSPLTPVGLSAGIEERIEQVAAMKADPPLTVECTLIESAAGNGTGYVLVHVPASPLAPHQVEGKYLGRGEKTKRYLSDAEVARLIRRRDQQQASAGQALADFTAADPYPGGSYAHLFITAQPVSQDAALCRELVSGANSAARVLALMQEITSGETIRDLLAGTYPHGDGRPRLHYSPTGHSRTADGVRLAPANLDTIDPAALERWTQHLEIREDGGIRYYDSRVGERGSGPQAALLGLNLVLVLTTFREILVLALELSRRYGFAGVWHLGVAVTGINGARMLIGGQGPGVVLRTHGRDSYTRDSYTMVSSASVREIEANPGRVTERLLGRLYRSLADGTPHAFTDLS